MKTLRNIIVSVVAMLIALPAIAQQKTSVQEIWTVYLNEGIPVEYYDAVPNIADFVYSFCKAHRGMRLTDEMENYLSVDGYRNADVQEHICDLKAGYVRLLFKSGADFQACYWNLPGGKKRVAVMLYDENDPAPYAFLRFYDYKAKDKDMFALAPMPVTEECDPTLVFYNLPRKGKDIDIIVRSSGSTGKYIFNGEESFTFDGSPECLGVEDGDGDLEGDGNLLYCILSSEEETPIITEEGQIIYSIPAGVYNIRLREPEEGMWRIVGYALDTAEEEYVIDTAYDGGLYITSDHLCLYTANYGNTPLKLYSMPDDDSPVVTIIVEGDSVVHPIGATEDYYWIHVVFGDYDGWIQITNLCSNPYTSCS